MKSEDFYIELSSNTTNSQPSISDENHLVNHDNMSASIFRILSFSSFYYAGMFFPLGLFLNVLLLLVFWHSKIAKSNRTRIYYLAMAYGEFGTVLFKDAWYFWASLGVPFVTGGFNPLGPLNSMSTTENNSYSWTCGLNVFLWYSHELFANYTFLLFEIDCVCTFYKTFGTNRLLTKRYSLILVC